MTFARNIQIRTDLMIKMEATAIKLTKPVVTKGQFLTFGILLSVFIGGCDGYSMEDYCNAEFYFLDYQINLELTDNNIYQTKENHYRFNRSGFCQSTFKASTTSYPKLMFYFEDLNLDCDKGHLEFYVGESTNLRVPGLAANICGANKPQGVFAVGKKGFRIKYVPERNQYISHIFSIIITRYREKETCPSDANLCANSRCIAIDIACNGYDSCGDGSGCDLTTGAIIGIVIGSLVGLFSVLICCICCIKTCRKPRRTGQRTPTAQSGYTQQDNSQPSRSSYPVDTATNIAATVPSGSSPPIYGYNQDTNYANNQAPYPNVASDTSQQIPDVDSLNAPPPRYSELFTTS